MSVSKSQNRLQNGLVVCGAALAGFFLLGAPSSAEAGDRHRNDRGSVVFDFDDFRLEFRHAAHRFRQATDRGGKKEWKESYYRELERKRRRVAQQQREVEQQRREFEREQRELARIERELDKARSKRSRRAYREAYRESYDDWWARTQRPRSDEYCPRTGRRIGA